MLAAVSDEAEESAARALVLAILIQMSRKLFDSTRQNSDLHLRRAGISVMTSTFDDLILLLPLRQHAGNDITPPAVLQDLLLGRSGRTSLDFHEFDVEKNA